MASERELFISAIERTTPADREAFLKEACGTDSELRKRIELLVTAHEDGSFMTRPPRIGDHDLGALSATGTVTLANDSSVSMAGRPLLTKWGRFLVAGQQLGRYQIEQEIGRGGMATVYLATDQRLKRRVALKIPHFDPREQPDLAARFHREARTMASVQHRNLCVIHDVDEHDGIPYLSMAYLDGRTLAQVLQAQEPFTSRAVAELMCKLARATHRAHEAGVVHRDLKPANVMIDQEGEPVIMDFGLALGPPTDARITQSGLIMGTPAYMSPEQACGDPSKVGQASDIYSLGAIMYELLSGQPAYAGNLSMVLGQLVAGKEPIPPRRVRSEVDGKLEAICLQAMARRAEDRFATAAELASALQHYLDDASEGPSRGVAAAESASSRGNAIGKWTLAGALTLAAAAAIVISLQTPYGTLIAQIDDDAIVAQVQGQKLTIRDTETERTYELTLNGRQTTQELPAGDYRIDVAEPASGLKLSAQSFQITRADQRPAVTVRFEAAKPPVSPVASTSSALVRWQPPENLGPGVNTDQKEENACVSSDGLTLIFNRDTNGFAQLWESRRSHINEPFGEATRLPEPVNVENSNQGGAFLSGDNLSLWFASDRPGGYGQHDLWVCRRAAVTDAWGEAVNLGPSVNTPKYEQSPYVSADELTMIYSADQPQGVFRLLQSTREKRDERFGQPRLLANVNNGVCSSFPRLTSDGLSMVFVHCANREQPLRLYLATRPAMDANFGSPMELDANINSAPASGPSLSHDGTRLYYCRQSESQFDLYSAALAK